LEEQVHKVYRLGVQEVLKLHQEQERQVTKVSQGEVGTQLQTKETAVEAGWFGGGGRSHASPGGGGSGHVRPGLDGITVGMGNQAFVSNPITTGPGFARITRLDEPVEIELELIGLEEMSIPLGSTFTDPGARVLRNDVETSIITGTGTVNANVAGTYTLTYTYTSNETNGTYTLTRTVHVVAPITNFDFTGGIQQVTLQPGVYRLETWGAQGGSVRGGRGGYSVGTFTVNEPTPVFVVVGGQGYRSNNFGYGGGGATHMSLATGHLTNTEVRNNILLVAGRRRRK